ncbi:MAG: hypothetical protein FJW34_21495 [Acidobacteria bacterium]|nr:hypothetical protein [Acidobacteriota bacterium]
MKGVQYVVDDGGQRTAVVIDLRKHAELWEDFYDRAVAESRRDEPRESLESVKAKLEKRRSRRARG